MFPHRCVAAALQASCTAASGCEVLVASSVGAIYLLQIQAAVACAIDRRNHACPLVLYGLQRPYSGASCRTMPMLVAP